MLLDLREYVRNNKPVKYTIITLICIPFVLFGVGSYFSGGGTRYAAKIDGEEIGIREYEQAAAQQRQRLQQMFGGQIPPGFGSEETIRQQALESLLTQQALRNTVAAANFTVSDKNLATAIQEIPGFQQDGQFDAERYKLQLRSSGMSIDQFEESMRGDAALGQFRSGIVDTAFELPGEKERLRELNGQLRVADTAVFPIEERQDAIEVSEEDIQAHFDENQDDYKFPQRVKIEYIDLNIDELSSAIEVSDDEAQQYYDDNRANYIVAEERKASHILLKPDSDDESAVAEAKKTLSDIKSRVESGEDFAEIAEEVSKDIGSAKNGGSLGQFGRGAMVAPFEDAIFAMTDIDSLSEPVESEFGVHLIKLEGIVEEHGAPFEDVKATIIGLLQQQQAGAEYADLLESVTEQAFDNPESLESAGEVTGLEVKASEWIDGTENSDPNPALANPLILSTALSDDVLIEGNNSEVLSVGERRNLVIRVLEHEDPRPKTIDDMREDIAAQLQNERAAEQLDGIVASVSEMLLAGEDPASLIDEEGGTFEQSMQLTRTSADADRSLVSELFKLSRPEADKPVVKSVVLGNGDRGLVALREVLPAPAATEEVEESDGPPVSARMGNNEFTALLNSLRESAEVEINDQLTSGEYGQQYQ